MHRFFALLSLAAGLALASVAPASAATFTVVTVADASDANTSDGVCAAASAGNQCTLRAAIGQAQFTPGADKIVVPAGTYQLTDGLGQLAVTSSVTIEGAGARATTLKAAAGSRVIAASANLVLRDLGVTGGSPKLQGAIRGGGLTVTAGDATLERVAVYGNTVTSATNASGGGVAADGGSLEILDSTFSGNTAIGKLDNSTGGNASGGGVAIASPTIIRRSTISGNTTRGFSAGSFSTGGGVSAADETTLEHVTLVGNVAATVADSSGFKMGGNLYVQGVGQRSLAGSILSGGAASNGPDCYIASGAVTEPARNASTTADCLGAASIRNAQLQLSPLASNGGPTDTARPAPTSPVVNAAASCGTRPTDQRGAKLPGGTACDLGAVELGADRRVTLQASKTAPAAGDEVTLLATYVNDGPDPATAESLAIALPPNATATSATSTLGACTTGATITCTFGDVASGAAATIVATFKASGEAGSITATRIGAFADPAPANDSVAVALGAGPAAATATGGNSGTVAPAPSTTPAGQPGIEGTPAGAPATAAPVISGLKLVGPATTRRGAALQFTLSAPAKVRVVTERLRPGRLQGTACKTGRKRGKACTRAAVTDTREITLPAGVARIAIPKRKLRAGKVRFTVTPSGGAAQALTATVRKR